jgi:hypothetical protein
MVSPAIATLWVSESAPVRRAIGPRAAALVRDLHGIFGSRRTWIGLMFLLSPWEARPSAT